LAAMSRTNPPRAPHVRILGSDGVWAMARRSDGAWVIVDGRVREATLQSDWKVWGALRESRDGLLFEIKG
jgi:hypothetical protein